MTGAEYPIREHNDTGWLDAYGNDIDPPRLTCPAHHTDGYLCTAGVDHDGDHIAHGIDRREIVRWSAR